MHNSFPHMVEVWTEHRVWAEQKVFVYKKNYNVHVESMQQGGLSCIQGTEYTIIHQTFIAYLICTERRGQQTCFTEEIVNILGFAGHKVSYTTAQLCCYNMKAAIDNTQTNECGCFLIALFIKPGDFLNLAQWLYLADLDQYIKEIQGTISWDLDVLESMLWLTFGECLRKQLRPNLW